MSSELSNPEYFMGSMYRRHLNPTNDLLSLSVKNLSGRALSYGVHMHCL